MNFLSKVLGSPCTISIDLDGVGSRENVEATNSEGKTEKLPLYIGNEPVKGTVQLKLEPNTKKIEHQGIKISLLGVISKCDFFLQYSNLIC